MVNKIKMKDRFKKSKAHRESYPHVVSKATLASPEWEPVMGDNKWVSFTGSSRLNEAPCNSAIIVVNGNGRTYDPGNYAKFKDALFIKVDSSQGRTNPNITVELVEALRNFVKRNEDVGVVVQCSYGEQRSVAIAKFISEDMDRLLDTSMPGCPSNTNMADEVIINCLLRTAHLVDRQHTNLTIGGIKRDEMVVMAALDPSPRSYLNIEVETELSPPLQLKP